MILIVDDERRYTLPYYEHLKLSGYRVEFRKDVVAAFHFLQEHLERIDVLVLDIMMPSGSMFTREETDNGLHTGVCFYDRVRKIAPRLPVIFLTNLSNEKLEERFQAEPYCRYIVKKTCLPHELGDEIVDLLADYDLPAAEMQAE